MLAEPQTITVNAVPKVMPKVLVDGRHSVFELPDKSFVLDVKHNFVTRDKKARVKSLVTFTQRAAVPDPLTSVNDWETVALSLQIDRPEVGFTSAQVDQLVQGFKTWLTTAMVGQLYGTES